MAPNGNQIIVHLVIVVVLQIVTITMIVEATFDFNNCSKDGHICFGADYDVGIVEIGSSGCMVTGTKQCPYLLTATLDTERQKINWTISITNASEYYFSIGPKEAVPTIEPNRAMARNTILISIGTKVNVPSKLICTTGNTGGAIRTSTIIAGITTSDVHVLDNNRIYCIYHSLTYISWKVSESELQTVDMDYKPFYLVAILGKKVPKKSFRIAYQKVSFDKSLMINNNNNGNGYNNDGDGSDGQGQGTGDGTDTPKSGAGKCSISALIVTLLMIMNKLFDC